MSRKSLYLPVVVAMVLAACGGETSLDTTVTLAAPATTGAADTTMADTTMTDTTMTDTTSVAPDTTGGGEACAVDTLALHEPGTLTIATGEPVFPPWMMDDDPTNGEGFESAVAYALAEQMGFAAEDVTWVRTGFDEAIAPGEKPYDFNMQQYSITTERDEVVDFSIPYYISQKSVVALADSPAAGATTFADLEAATFGATIGTTDLDYIEQVLGITDAAVYNTQADTIAAMVAGQIDATVVSLPTAYFLTAVELENGVIAGVLPEEGGEGSEGEGMGLLFTEGNALVDCVNQALQVLTDDGTLEAIELEWLEQGGDIPLITE